MFMITNESNAIERHVANCYTHDCNINGDWYYYDHYHIEDRHVIPDVDSDTEY